MEERLWAENRNQQREDDYKAVQIALPNARVRMACKLRFRLSKAFSLDC